MTKTISSSEARKRFAEIIDEVQKNKTSYSVIRHGKAVLTIGPPNSANMSDSIDPQFDTDLKEFVEEYREALTELAKQ